VIKNEKRGKDKNKDLSILIDERLVEINNPILTLTGKRWKRWINASRSSSTRGTFMSFEGRCKGQ